MSKEIVVVLDVPHPLVVTVTVPQDSAAVASPSDTGNRSASHCVPLTFGWYIVTCTSAEEHASSSDSTAQPATVEECMSCQQATVVNALRVNHKAFSSLHYSDS